MTHAHLWLLRGRCRGSGGRPALRYKCDRCGKVRICVMPAAWL